MPAHRRYDRLRKRIFFYPCSEQEAAKATSGQSWFLHVRRLDHDASDLRHVLACKLNDDCVMPQFSSYIGHFSSIEANCAGEFLHTVLLWLGDYKHRFEFLLNNVLRLEGGSTYLVEQQILNELKGLTNVIVNDIEAILFLNEANHNGGQESGTYSDNVSRVYEMYANTLRDFDAFLSNALSYLRILRIQ
ncbi:uncharacterized protein LOC127857180 [Dreissena polymorpha]|uniref:uncharacterized protein LOC127857180 n=1 Tax=Dreissena polymorpha TaxID=45954 RepID=UPI002263B5D1|nr:uncharacterized protein LOC127857180 [Dreissena polymorpha]